MRLKINPGPDVSHAASLGFLGERWGKRQKEWQKKECRPFPASFFKYLAILIITHSLL
jgi:hypothetical protein